MTATEQSLSRAAAEGDVDSVRALLAQGVNVNACTSGGQTALMLALIGGHEEVVQLLYAAGADPRLRDSRGLTALDWAERRGFRELASSLRSQTSNSTSNTPRVDSTFQSQHELRPESGVQSHDKTQRWLAGLKKRLQEEEERQALADLSFSLTGKGPEETVSESILDIPEDLPVVPAEDTVSGSLHTVAELQHCGKCNEFHDQFQPCVSESPVETQVKADITPSFLTASPSGSHRTTIWLLIVVTLAASAFVTHYLYGYLSRPTPNISTPATTPAPVTQPPTTPPVEERTNSPELSETLAGKELNLPEPEYPAAAKTRGIGGTVVVRVRVNRGGRVVAARSADGDWHLCPAAVEAATKATFDPAKLSNRGVQGTISYTFNP